MGGEEEADGDGDGEVEEEGKREPEQKKEKKLFHYIFLNIYPWLMVQNFYVGSLLTPTRRIR